MIRCGYIHIMSDINPVIIGNATLYRGDCLDILPLLHAIDVTITDPPYGINLEYNSYVDSEENWNKLMLSFIPSVRSISKMVILPSCRIAKLKFIYDNFPPDWLICWYKGSPGHQSFIGFNDWEPHLVYGKSRSNLSMHDHFQTVASVPMGSFGHPCPKPIEWANWLIEKSSLTNDIILDPFMGSGTTGCSAIARNRRFIGIEKDDKYFDIACKRIDDASRQKSLFDGLLNKQEQQKLI